MTQTSTITPARQAMLEKIKIKAINVDATNKSTNQHQSNQKKKKKQRNDEFVKRNNQRDLKKQVDQKRRSAYIIRLAGRMI